MKDMQINNLTLSFGVQDIFRDINLYIPKNEKVGIVGVNGAGKSTFFKVIMGIVESDEGTINLESNARIGYLPQIISDEIPNLNISVYEFLWSARPIDKLNSDLEYYYEKMGSATTDKELNNIYNKIEKTQKRLEYWEYYSAESILLKIVDGMNITSEMLNHKLNELSGGQKSKVAFARLLFSKPEIILLDEPTNHLDSSTKEFIESYLKGYKGSVYVISHDIEFLNNVTTKILFIDKRTKKMELYDGNYDKFKKVHKEREESLINQAKIQEREIERLQDFVDKYASSSGKRKKMVQDREKKIEKLQKDKIELAPTQKTVNLKMEMDRESSNIPLKVENLCFKYDKILNKNIIDNLTFDISKGEKFLIVGENGVGKSTLLKLIMGILEADSGNIKIEDKTDIAYYAQEHELLDNSKTILDNFNDLNVSQRSLRAVLGRFLFFGDDINKKVSVLSPGERSRVALAKLSMQGANLLILDEPTNHLDPETQSIISDTFKTFKGTMLIVSHNPAFVDNLGVERILFLPSGKISYYNREVVQHYHELNNQK